MIELELSEAIFFYLLFSVIGVFLLWILQEKRYAFATMLDFDERVIWKCAICSYDYIDSKHETISACPRCGSYNERSAASAAGTERGEMYDGRENG